MLLEEFLKPLEINPEDLGCRMDVPFRIVNGLVDGSGSVTADTALRLSRVFGTTALFWANHQLRWDLYHAREAAGEALDRIEPLPRGDEP